VIRFVALVAVPERDAVAAPLGVIDGLADLTTTVAAVPDPYVCWAFIVEDKFAAGWVGAHSLHVV
jgi:hypothetical protein